MISVSEAIRNDASSDRDVLLSTYVGAMDPAELAGFTTFEPQLNGRFPGRFSHCLMGTFPQLGASVRQWPKLAEELEQRGRIPRVKPLQTKYRAAIHVSLWQVLASLQGVGQSKTQIADLLERHGL